MSGGMAALGLAGLSAACWAYLALGHGRFWQAGPVLRPAAPRVAPAITVVVPARDEAEGVGRCLRSLLAQDYAGPLSVVLVDDGSTDGTGDIARAIGDARLLVLRGAARPAGWSGKLWALSQGVTAARSELLLLSDADIEHDPRHVATLVAQLERGGLDLVSEMVALNCASAAERALVPAFVFFFQLLYPFARVNDRHSHVAAAAGGTVLVRSEALARAGGLSAMRGALIDDVTLAGLVKRLARPGPDGGAGADAARSGAAGSGTDGGARPGGIWLGHSALARSIRPYPGAGDVWRMVARTAYVQLRFSPALLAGTVLGMVVVWMAPPALAILGHGAARWLGLAGWACACLCYLPTLRRFGLSPLRAPLLPLVALFYTAATIGSAVDHHRGRGVVWKRRAYREAGA